MIKDLFLDINLTDTCNLRCSYCFERDFFKKESHQDVLDLNLARTYVDFINFCLNEKGIQRIRIGLWGGEPTLKEELIDFFIKSFSNEKRVQFFIFSNGYSLSNHIKKIMLESDQFEYVQISYDGNPIHDMHRVNIHGDPTSSKVIETIKYFSGSKKLGIKSTLPVEDFKYLYEAYLDVSNLIKMYNIPNTTFNPSIEYKGNYNDNINNYLPDLEISLLKIANHIKKTGENYFTWFLTQSKALCSAGYEMFFLSGKDIYVCHGALYEKETSQDHLVSNFNKSFEDIFQDLLIKHKLLDLNNFTNSFENKQCNKCVATYCTRCNITKYKYSTKENYIDRWIDFQDQQWLCKCFQLNGKIKLALDRTKYKGVG